MNFWEKVKQDLEKGLKEGVSFVKESAAVVKGKADELTEEAKRQYKIYDLKSKVHKWMAELGGLVYQLQAKRKDPLKDSAVRSVISRIGKLESRISRLELKRSKGAPAKKTAKRK